MIRVKNQPPQKRPLLLFLILFSLYNPVNADIYYVDNSQGSNCTNTNSAGNESNPWCTITYALRRIESGDTLYVKSGTFNENFYISNFVGTAERPTLISVLPGHSATIIGNGINTGRIKISGCHHLTFEGFEITNFNQGIFIEGLSSFVTVKSCTVHHIGQEGIHVKENSSYITIDKNIIYDTDQYIYNGEGIYIGTGSGGPSDNTHHVIISNNLIYDVGDEAIELKPGTHDCIVQGNIVYNAVSDRSWGAIEINESTSGAQSWSSNPNHIVRNNIVHDTDTAIRAGTGCTIYNNIIYDVGIGDYGIYVDNRANDNYPRLIYHNTIDVVETHAIRESSSQADIKNNIGPNFRYNMISDMTFYISTVEGEENYHLRANSSPINAGLDLSDVVNIDIDNDERPIGGQSDYGADEYDPIKPPRNLRILHYRN